MENTPTPNRDFEKLLRRQLEQIDEQPDENTWADISTRQGPRNVWLRLRYWSTWVLPAVVLLTLAVAGWWTSEQNQTPAPEKDRTPASPGRPAAPSAQTQMPVALAPLKTEGGAAFSTVPQNRTPLPGSIYGSRANTVPASQLHFQAEAGLDYENPATGTRVRIPANSLTHADGRPVRGKVELLFREYRDIADFLASGIPMHYGDERGSYFFNSGGMFDVRVLQDGLPVQMAPGQTYDLTFTPTNELTQAHLYYFDEQKDSWRYQPSEAFGKPPAQPTAVTAADVARDNRRQYFNGCLPEYLEVPVKEDPAEWVQAAVQTGYLLAADKMKMPLWFRKNPFIDEQVALNGLQRGQIRVVRNRDQAELFFPEDAKNVFTELKAFKDCYFKRAADTLALATGFGPDEHWQSISIYRETGNLCHFWLYGEQGLTEFYASLTASPGNKHFDAEKVMADYERQRTERQNNLTTLVRNLKRFSFMAPVFQSEDEWCMPLPNWLEFFEKNHPRMLQRYEALDKAGLANDNAIARKAWESWGTRLRNLYYDRFEQVNRGRTESQKSAEKTAGLRLALRLSSFGLHNCDQIFRLGTDYIYAAYEDKNGSRIVPASVSVMARDARLFFTLPDPARMLRLPGRVLEILVTDPTGRSFRLSGDRYAALDLKDVISKDFVLEEVTEKTRSPREWADLLQL